jgi:hypothetical protein
LPWRYSPEQSQRRMINRIATAPPQKTLFLTLTLNILLHARSPIGAL